MWYSDNSYFIKNPTNRVEIQDYFQNGEFLGWLPRLMCMDPTPGSCMDPTPGRIHTI